jgi:hypothetical protein
MLRRNFLYNNLSPVINGTIRIIFSLRQSRNLMLESRTATEEILVGRDTVEVPVQLYANPEVFASLFSMETWQQDLSLEVKEHLMVKITFLKLFFSVYKSR